jgi:putative ABC transport system permease protein
MRRSCPDPPRIAEWIIKTAARYEDNDSLFGDIDEEYIKLIEKEGEVFARKWYRRQAIRSLPVFIHDMIFWRFSMLWNFLKVALRNFRKNRIYSIINLFGLTVGLVCSVLIYLWILDETSFDRFHDNADQIYRVLSGSTETNQYHPYGPGPLAPGLKENFPEVIHSARIFIVDKNPVGYKDKVMNISICGTDPSFFDVFTFPLLAGDRKTALAAPDGVVMTETTARKLFGNESSLGKTLRFEWWGRWLDFKVTGVIQDVPVHSHLQFELLLPITFVKASGMRLDLWDSSFLHTYVMLQRSVNTQVFERKLFSWQQNKFPGSKIEYRLEPLKRIHLYHYAGGGPVTYVIIFSFIGLLILLIACINFMNLSTARSANRAREVGLRKVVGSSRRLLVKQFLGESFFMCLTALLFALILMMVLLPYFNQFFGKNLMLIGSPAFVTGLVCIILFTGMVAGGYPAFYLSAFKPTEIFQRSGGGSRKSAIFRKSSVIVQFVISMFLIICSIIVYKQLLYIQNRQMGFNREHILQFELRGGLRRQYGSIRNELMKNPDILSISATNGSFFRRFSTSAAKWEGKQENEDLSMAIHSVDYDYFDTFGLEMAEGRYFSPDFSTDYEQGIIVNQTAVKAMGMDSPIGKHFLCPVPYGSDKDGQIIGVVKDYHFRSYYEPIAPLILVIAPGWFSDVYIKIRSGNIHSTLEFIEKTMKRLAPDYVLEYRFLDEAIDSLYQSEYRMKGMIEAGTALAIILALLGLFGLASYSSEKRTKEVGIRKVLGASVPGVVFLLSREYVIFTGMAAVLAWPLAYFIMKGWLGHFAYQVPVGFGIFLWPSLFMLVITLITVIRQTVKTASSNPVDCLRYE